MTENIIKIPNIGTSDEADVIEVLIKPGDKISADDSLITLESDKASMDIPSPQAGVVADVKIKVGDKAKEGDIILTLQADDQAVEVKAEAKAGATVSSPAESVASTVIKSVTVPDLSGSSDVDVIELLVNVGDEVQAEDALITLEGDKATMEVPSPTAGKITEITVKIGDKINEGDLILNLETTETATRDIKPASDFSEAVVETPPSKSAQIQAPKPNGLIHAGPAVRRIATEFGVDLTQITGSGAKNRILKEDVQQYIKSRLAGASTVSGGLQIEPIPVVDFSQFGEIEIKPLNKIKRLTGKFTHRSWVTIPHVTQFDEADITKMENFRKSAKQRAEKEGFKLTPLAFIMKAVSYALKEYPQFNSSLGSCGESLILKKYINIGIAVDTPNGLVVPVIRDVDKKGIFDLAREMGDVGKKAREKKLTPKDMQGGCFTISSLGGIGGTAFTPIVNGTDVAILGVSRAKHQPVYIDGEFVPRLMLPLSLSYDHRVIDGAEAARFTTFLARCLTDIRNLLL